MTRIYLLIGTEYFKAGNSLSSQHGVKFYSGPSLFQWDSLKLLPGGPGDLLHKRQTHIETCLINLLVCSSSTDYCPAEYVHTH